MHDVFFSFQICIDSSLELLQSSPPSSIHSPPHQKKTDMRGYSSFRRLFRASVVTFRLRYTPMSFLLLRIQTPANSCSPAASSTTLGCVKSQVGVLRLKEGGQPDPGARLLSSRPAVFRAVDEYLANVRREILYRVVRLVRQILLDGSQVDRPLYEAKVVRVLEKKQTEKEKFVINIHDKHLTKTPHRGFSVSF